MEDEDILAARDEISHAEGLLTCPEGAATYAAYKQALSEGRISVEDTVVLYNCATGLKYPLPAVEQSIDCTQPPDFAAMRALS